MIVGPSSCLRGLLALATLAFVGAGCGDGPICPSEIVLVLQSPSNGANFTSNEDVDPAAAGLQADIAVRSNFKSGATLTLTVVDDRTGAVAQDSATTNSDGDATFSSVTLPSGPVTLTVEGASECGTGSDEVAINVVTDGLCDLSITNGPIANDFYAPIPVLNSSNDGDPALPNFQANMTVQTAPGFEVEVFVLDVAAGSEASIGTATADADGLSSFEATLAQGNQAIRATCVLSGSNAASATRSVFVDTVVPSCTLNNPAEGVTVTPDDDEDGNDQNGIQMTWTGTVDDASENDTVGEAASFFRDTTEFAGSDIDANGDSATTSLAEFNAPGSYALSFNTQDHAANACLGGAFTANVIMAGCSIVIAEPSGTVTSDSDSNDANGLQADFTVQVGTECAGQAVFVDCGQGEVSATAPGNGTTVIANVTLDTDPTSEGSASCTARVINADNFQTSNQRTVPYDTAAPGVVLNFINPATLACGDSIVFDVANDFNLDLSDGFQINVRALAPLAVTREFRIINAACAGPAGCVTPESAPSANTQVTLELGSNDVQAVARDAVGNEGVSGACNISLADIAVDIDPPTGDGALSANDGTINGSNLDVTVCGTVSENTVTLTVTLDGATVFPATVAAGAWCTDSPVPFTTGAHTVLASANSTIDASVGSALVNVNVDFTPPNTPTGLTAFAPDRQSIDASWSAQADAVSFMLRVNEGPFVDFPNDGVQIAVGAGTSGTAAQLRIGASYFVGVASVDAAGNISAPTTLGPFVPLLDATGAFDPPGVGDGTSKGLGYDIAYADFNADGFDDVALSAPFTQVGGVDSAGAVHIYLGSANGISATPALTINGPATFAQFGFGMTAINWGGGAEDGLAIGAPFADGFNGRVFVFHDTTIAAAIAAATDLTSANADITLSVNGADGANWFSFSAMGASLASGQVDAAGTPDDLIIGAPLGGGAGGFAVVYGGTPTASTILMSDNLDAGMAGLVGHYFENPEATANAGLLGIYVEYLGDTRTGNGVGDISASYFADDMNAIDDRVFVLRGRTSLPAAGIDQTTLGATDLTVVLENSTAAGNAFGESMGSIDDQGVDGFRDILISKSRGNDSRLFIVSGAQTGTLTLNNTTGFLTNIARTVGTDFASGVANNAEIPNPDINNDGIEDLVVIGGRAGVGDGVQLHIWLGGEIPVGATTAASATDQISAPAEFDGAASNGQKRAREVQWVGDVNNDGLSDICWADYFHEFDSTPGTPGGLRQEGVFEVLWDDGL